MFFKQNYNKTIERQEKISLIITRAGTAVLHVTSLEAEKKFYISSLGVFETESTDDALYLRAHEQPNHYRILLKKAEKHAVKGMSYNEYIDYELDKSESIAKHHYVTYQ